VRYLPLRFSNSNSACILYLLVCYMLYENMVRDSQIVSCIHTDGQSECNGHYARFQMDLKSD
jgi:hypothetical protein